MTWILWICIGITGLGCGDSRSFEFQNEDACYKALASMRFDATEKKSVVAACRPRGMK